MNITGLQPGFGPMQPPMGSPMGGQSSMMMMVQMLMQMMMQVMSMQMGSQGMMSGANPGFGGQAPGIPGQMGGGGMPGFGQFGGSGSCGCGSGSGGYGGPSGYNGGSGSGGGNYGSTPFNSRDTYVPPGANQSGNVGNLGSGQGSDAVRWALSHEGVSESNNPGMVRAFSRGNWQAWCADFVSQAYANTPGGSPFGHQSSVQGILNWGRNNNKFFSAGQAASNPGSLRPGDIAVWKSGGRSHVGLVTGVNRDGTFNTIEGNSGDAVRRRTHSFGRGLTGFVRPREGGASGSGGRPQTRSA